MSESAGPCEVRFAAPVLRDIAAILKWSRREFGNAAAQRYDALIKQALRDIGEDPELPGSQEKPRSRSGMRSYHLALSKARVPGPRVKEPRHFVLYRRVDPNVVEVARILHDGRDLRRNLPSAYWDGPPETEQ